jgi:GNAT superfamily N-acetyltransferase
MDTSQPFQISRAVPSDAAILTEIAVAAKGHWGYPARWMDQWRPVLTVSASFIAHHDTYIARRENQILGYAALRQDAAAIHLEDLFVLPAAMGRGVGRALFFHARERAHELGFAALEIQSDPNAAGFYERMGAQRVGTHFMLLDSQRRDLPLFRCPTAGRIVPAACNEA